MFAEFSHALLVHITNSILNVPSINVILFYLFGFLFFFKVLLASGAHSLNQCCIGSAKEKIQQPGNATTRTS